MKLIFYEVHWLGFLYTDLSGTPCTHVELPDWLSAPRGFIGHSMRECKPLTYTTKSSAESVMQTDPASTNRWKTKCM